MVKNLQKIAFLKSPLLIAAGICFAVAFVFSLSPEKTPAAAVKGINEKVSATVTLTPSPSDSVESTTFIPSATPVQASPTQGTQTQNNARSTNQNPTATPVPQQAVETFEVTLLINGSSVGNVVMQKDANQCDVLSRAKDQGKISSLLMKYDNSLGTNGVYQINGIGKENSVWWVYKVNGQSPTQGCSNVKANSGDKVEWEYKG